MIYTIDWEHEYEKNLGYLQEDVQEFYQSLNNSEKAQVEVFISDEIKLIELQVLQEKARINICIPQSLVAKIDRKIIKNHERKINALSF